MLVKDYASLEAVIDKGEPSRLLIEIALRPVLLAGAAPTCDEGEIQRAIRDGFREVLAQIEIERLARMNPPKSRARRWLGRVFAFILCAAIGSVATLLLSASHTAPQYAVGSMAPSDHAAPSIESPSPGSQSTAAPPTSGVAPAAPPAGPATFGLHEQ